MKRISAAAEEADIVDLSHEGRGVTRLDGKAVFVTDALPGERVVLRRVRRHRNFDEAVLESVIEASPDRVVPQCPHFGLCGGCALQHMAPAAQLAFKQSQLLENLARLGGVQAARVLEPLAGPVGNVGSDGVGGAVIGRFVRHVQGSAARTCRDRCGGCERAPRDPDEPIGAIAVAGAPGDDVVRRREIQLVAVGVAGQRHRSSQAIEVDLIGEVVVIEQHPGGAA